MICKIRAIPDGSKKACSATACCSPTRTRCSRLTERWRDLFNANFDVLLYDLTSTYFEVNASDLPEGVKRRHGYSRDKRPDCPQLVIALVVTPEGLPLAYEVLPGNTADSKTLRTFLSKIEKQYGKARRVWVMDRGVPTEAVLAEMRASDPPVQYLVGTPKGRLNRLEKHLIEKPWQKARAGARSNCWPRTTSLCLRPERRSRRQGTRDAAAAVEMAVGPARQARRYEREARRDADETGRGALEGADRMASGRSRARQGERRADLLPQSRETANRQATGGALSAAHEFDRQGSGRLVAILRSTRRRGGNFKT